MSDRPGNWGALDEHMDPERRSQEDDTYNEMYKAGWAAGRDAVIGYLKDQDFHISRTNYAVMESITPPPYTDDLGEDDGSETE